MIQIEQELYENCQQFHPSFSFFESDFVYLSNRYSEKNVWNGNGLIFDIEENEQFNNQGAYETLELPSYYIDNINILKEGFNKEFGNNHHYFKLEKDIVQESFDKAASIISELPFNYASVEFTTNKAIKFSLSFEEGKLLMITKFIEAEMNEPILYSLFVNRKLIASNVSEISSFTAGFKEFLSM
jgi:hypothetical protein